VDEPTRVRQIRPERIWTTAGRPRSAKREGVNPRDGVHNPRHRQVTRRFIEGAFCVSGGEGGVDEPTRVRQIRPERIWTTAGRPRSAKREGVNPRDGVHNPRPRQVTRRFIEGAFCISGGEGGVDEPTRVRQIRLERIWTTAGRPRSAKREGVNPTGMGFTIPVLAK